MRLLRTSTAALLLVIGLVSCARQPNPRVGAGGRDAKEHSEVIRIAGPTIVAFFPPMTDEEIDASEGAGEALAHINFALSDAARCLVGQAVTTDLVMATELVVESAGSRSRLRPAHDLGAYLLAPGRPPCVVYAEDGPSTLQVSLPHAAGEYFSVPSCLNERLSPICR